MFFDLVFYAPLAICCWCTCEQKGMPSLYRSIWEQRLRYPGALSWKQILTGIWVTEQAGLQPLMSGRVSSALAGVVALYYSDIVPARLFWPVVQGDSGVRQQFSRARWLTLVRAGQL